LGAVHLVEEPTRDDDRRVPRIATGRERVGRRVLDQEEPRRGHPKTDRERLDDVVKLRLLVRSKLARLALREDELVTGEVRHERRADGERERERQRGDPTAGGEVLAD